MTANEKQLSKQLAIRYEAFIDAVNRHDKESRATWAQMLKETQEKIGIELISNEVLDSYRKR